MKVVIDAIPVVPLGGYAVALEGLLRGWSQLEVDDEVHLLLTEGVALEVPGFVHAHRFRVGRPEVVRRVAVQSRAARKICRSVAADALLATLPTTAVTAVGCPKVITVYDMRHELRPDQFTLGRRVLRRFSYGIGYRQAAAVICISERTRSDLLRSRPWLGSKPVLPVLFGADHVDDWPRRPRAPGDEPYALAFGHFPNKAVDRVIEAWALLRERGEARPLALVGLPTTERARLAEPIRDAGLEGIVTLLPWLDDETFRARFASAALIVFPSDFEGFGLPAIEAMRLGIPLVISKDEALLEVTGGNATVVQRPDAEFLADAVAKAWATPATALQRASAWVDRYSWKETARQTRAVLERVAEVA